jgi:hypothetical protein
METIITAAAQSGANVVIRCKLDNPAPVLQRLVDDVAEEIRPFLPGRAP